MVFVALPALQRSQRDTQRREDMARLITAIQNYQTNNKGNVPTAFTSDSDLVKNYLLTNGDTFNDPSTNSTYTFETSITTCSSTSCAQGSTGDAMGVIHVYKSATCDGSNPKFISGNGRLAFTINLEGAGIYCTSN